MTIWWWNNLKIRKTLRAFWLLTTGKWQLKAAIFTRQLPTKTRNGRSSYSQVQWQIYELQNNISLNELVDYMRIIPISGRTSSKNILRNKFVRVSPISKIIPFSGIVCADVIFQLCDVSFLPCQAQVSVMNVSIKSQRKRQKGFISPWHTVLVHAIDCRLTR